MAIIETIFLAIIFVISISLHEYAHARSSYKLGDPTPKIQGRLTPNPLVHIDLIGFLMIFLIHFGRGRPVIVNPAYYKNTLRDELLVALAGPATNILLAIIANIILLIYTKIVGLQVLYASNDLIIQFWYLFARINVALAVFNMIPIYPLDGYRVVKYLWPKVGYLMEQYRQYITIGLLLVIFLPGTGSIVSNFIISTSQIILGGIHLVLSMLFW